MRMTANKRRILDFIKWCVEDTDPTEVYAPNADEIARELKLDRGNVRRTLYNMEKQGLVRREKVMGYYSTRFCETINRECIGWIGTDMKLVRIEKKPLTDEEKNKLLDRIFGKGGFGND